MKDHNLPKDTYHELVSLMGKKEADEFIESVQHDYRAIHIKIFRLRISKLVKEHNDFVFVIAVVSGLWVAWKILYGFFF